MGTGHFDGLSGGDATAADLLGIAGLHSGAGDADQVLRSHAGERNRPVGPAVSTRTSFIQDTGPVRCCCGFSHHRRSAYPIRHGPRG